MRHATWVMAMCAATVTGAIWPEPSLFVAAHAILLLGGVAIVRALDRAPKSA